MQPRMVEALSLGVVTVIDWLPSRSLDRRQKHENPESVKLSKFSHLEFVEFQNPFFSVFSVEARGGSYRLCWAAYGFPQVTSFVPGSTFGCLHGSLCIFFHVICRFLVLKQSFKWISQLFREHFWLQKFSF